MALNRGQGFDLGPVHVGYVVQNVELGQAFVRIVNILNILYKSFGLPSLPCHALITS